MRTPTIKPTMPPTRPNDRPPIAPPFSAREEVRSRVPGMTRVYIIFGDDVNTSPRYRMFIGGVDVPVMGCRNRDTSRDVLRDSVWRAGARRSNMFWSTDTNGRRNQRSPVPRRLVVEHGTEYAGSGAAERFGQRPVADHVRDRQILDRDRVEPAYKVGGGLAQEAAPCAGGPCVTTCDLDFGLPCRFLKPGCLRAIAG